MGEGDPGGTQSSFPSGTTSRRGTRSGSADSRTAAGAGRGCRPRSAPQPQVGSRCLPRGLDGSGATATERRGLRGCAPCARGEGASRRKLGETRRHGRSVAPSSRGASALPPRGRCAEAARGFPLELGEGTHGRLYRPPGEGRSCALRPRVGAQEGLASSRWVWGSASGCGRGRRGAV